MINPAAMYSKCMWTKTRLIASHFIRNAFFGFSQCALPFQTKVSFCFLENNDARFVYSCTPVTDGALVMWEWITLFLSFQQLFQWSSKICDFASHPGVKIRQALGPMFRKIAWGPSKLTLSGPQGPQILRIQWYRYRSN